MDNLQNCHIFKYQVNSQLFVNEEYMSGNRAK